MMPLSSFGSGEHAFAGRASGGIAETYFSK
jgi:hypothetical protein